MTADGRTTQPAHSSPHQPSRAAHPALQAENFVPLDAAGAATFDDVLRRAIAEDVGSGDITTESLIGADSQSSASIVARTAGVIAGLPVAARVFALVEPAVQFAPAVRDGDRVDAGATIARVFGPTRGLLTAERVALNLLGRLSGIATLTRRYVDAVGTNAARIADTRKTTPGLRALERYAVRAGGGANHRLDLAGAVLVKDNHLAAVSSVEAAVEAARARAPQGTIVEIECETLDQVREALAAGADALLLDNMPVDAMHEAVGLAQGKAAIEASGGMTLERVREVAATGVDVISVGALTHSAPALDVALDFISSGAKPPA